MAWVTNMGLGRMGDISDITFATLASNSENFLRRETLKAANDCISNAIAALTIFRHYDIANVVYSSSDGQKFETALPTLSIPMIDADFPRFTSKSDLLTGYITR